MFNRRTRPLEKLDTSHAVKCGAIIYISLSLAVLSMAVFIYPEIIIYPFGQAHFESIGGFIPLLVGALYLMGLGFIGLLIRKCQKCQSGQGKRITAALDKLGNGDLGWRITIRRGDEMAEVAESITRASRSLAERVARLQSKARELSGVEEFLLDSIDPVLDINPYTLKALRKLKICTSRLIADMEDFQVSTLPQTPSATIAANPSKETVQV